MTAQTLFNDLNKGQLDATDVILLVVGKSTLLIWHHNDRRVTRPVFNASLTSLTFHHCRVSSFHLIRFALVCPLLCYSDEAHKATSNHAYCQVIRFLQSNNHYFRILALTATPSGKPEGVQMLIDNLHVSHIEIRDEESLDLRRFVHKKVSLQVESVISISTRRRLTQ